MRVSTLSHRRINPCFVHCIVALLSVFMNRGGLLVHESRSGPWRRAPPLSSDFQTLTSSLSAYHYTPLSKNAPAPCPLPCKITLTYIHTSWISHPLDRVSADNLCGTPKTILYNHDFHLNCRRLGQGIVSKGFPLRYIYMCVCMCVYVCLYVCVYMCVCKCVCIYIYIYISKFSPAGETNQLITIFHTCNPLFPPLFPSPTPSPQTRRLSRDLFEVAHPISRIFRRWNFKRGGR